MHKSFIIVDDFYPNPDEIRAHALSGKFYDNDHYVGLDSDQKLFHEGLDPIICQLTGDRVTGAIVDTNNHGAFRVTLAAQKSEDYRVGIHVDSNDCVWAGIVCLALPEHIPAKGTGTLFFRHKEHNIVRLPLNPQEEKKWGVSYHDMRLQVDRESTDYDKWEYLYEMPFAYNRLVLFRPWHFHDSGTNFGDRPENGRLIQTLFFQRVI